MSAAPVTFLVDVDNTLLDNDRIRLDIQEHFAAAFGADAAARYWAIEERRFVVLGYRDYLGATQEWWEAEGREPELLAAAQYLLDYPFADRLYEGALAVLERFGDLGPTAVLTDGDAVFQPHKVERAGIGKAVDGNILVYVHKELELDDVERRYPAERYVLIDDKPRILSAAKAFWGERVTTVQPLQGQFSVGESRADLVVENIGDLLAIDPGAY